MLAMGLDELEISKLSFRPEVARSRVGRESLYCDTEVNHKKLYWDYFSQRST